VGLGEEVVPSLTSEQCMVRRPGDTAGRRQHSRPTHSADFIVFLSAPAL